MSNITSPKVLVLVSNLIMVNLSDTWIYELMKILVYHHLSKSKLSLRTALYAIIYYFATIWCPTMILVL